MGASSHNLILKMGKERKLKLGLKKIPFISLSETKLYNFHNLLHKL